MNPGRNVWVALWEGMTRPAPAALLIALAVNVTVVAVLSIYFSPQVFPRVSAHRYLMENPWDRAVPVTAKLMGYQGPGSSSELPDVVILGASVIARCIVGEEELARKVAAAGGVTPVIHNLTVDGQSALDMQLIAENLPAEFDGVVVIGMGLGFFIRDFQEDLLEMSQTPIYGITSDRTDEVMRASGLSVPYRTGNYLIDNWRFLLVRRTFFIRNLLIADPQPYGDPLDESWVEAAYDPDSWDDEIAEFSDQKEWYEVSRRPANLEAAIRVLEDLKSKNLPIVLVENPVHPGWDDIPGGRELFDRVHADLQSLAAEYGAAHVVTEPDMFSQLDFADYKGHLRSRDARDRCATVVAAGIAEALRHRRNAAEQSASPDGG